MLLILTLVSGIARTIWGPLYLSGFSLISLHIYLAVPLVVLLAWHVWRERFVFRLPQSRDRRVVLRGLALMAAGGLTLEAVRQLRLRGLGQLPRRFTGSYETGSYLGRFPNVSWIADQPPAVDLQTWRLLVAGEVRNPLVFSYEHLLDLTEDEITAVLDCTGGWYSEQIWRGVRLDRLFGGNVIGKTARSLTLESLTGYNRRFAIEEAGDLMLALFVAGKPLSQGHGFPVRLVAPGYRGFDWVKWISQIRVNRSGPGWQPPVPLQ